MTQTRADAPNILLITTDHQRFDQIAAHGNEAIHTPNLDRLVESGVSLQRCYVQSPICMPSRASIWTGRYPQNHRVTTNGIPLRKDERNLAHHCHHAGYRTINVGKLHFQPHFGPDRDHTKNDTVYAGYGYEINELSDEPGCYEDAYLQWVRRVAPEHLDAMRVPGPTGARGHFDGWTLAGPEEFSHTAWVCRRGCEHLQHLAAPAADAPAPPFFLSLGIYAPHPPLNPAQRWRDLYRDAELPMPLLTEDDYENGRHRQNTMEQWRQAMRDFYAMVSMLDHWVGQVLETLDRTALAENTIVVFMSDHGDALSDYGQWAKFPPGLESMLRVPCIIRWPDGLPANHRPEGMIEAVDLLPTLCDLAGLDLPPGVDGRSAAELLRGRTDTHRDSVLTEHKNPRNGDSVKVLRTERHKYILDHTGAERLHDMTEPRPEAHNHADDPAWADTLHAMRHRLLLRLIDAEDDLPERLYDY